MPPSAAGSTVIGRYASDPTSAQHEPPCVRPHVFGAHDPARLSVEHFDHSVGVADVRDVARRRKDDAPRAIGIRAQWDGEGDSCLADRQTQQTGLRSRDQGDPVQRRLHGRARRVTPAGKRTGSGPEDGAPYYFGSGNRRAAGVAC